MRKEGWRVGEGAEKTARLSGCAGESARKTDRLRVKLHNNCFEKTQFCVFRAIVFRTPLNQPRANNPPLYVPLACIS